MCQVRSNAAAEVFWYVLSNALAPSYRTSSRNVRLLPAFSRPDVLLFEAVLIDSGDSVLETALRFVPAVRSHEEPDGVPYAHPAAVLRSALNAPVVSTIENCRCVHRLCAVPVPLNSGPL